MSYNESQIEGLPRVYLKSKPGIIGALLQEDTVAETVQIHWGVQDGVPVRSWTPRDEVCFIEEE